MRDAMYDGTDWNWGLMMVMPLLLIVVLGLVFWLGMRLTQRDAPPSVPAGQPMESRESPRDVLDRRYAAGEIDAAEYTEARNHLAGR